MLSARSWAAARRYVVPPLTAGLLLAAARRPAAVPFLAAAGVVLLFFRDPDRLGPAHPDPGLVYAPADGAIAEVAYTDAIHPLPGEWLRVSIYLGLHNVHVVRSPVGGTLLSWDQADGRLRPAKSAWASAGNRQARLSIQSAGASIGLTLVAGTLARRITAWVRPGDRLACGDRLGIIHFGSRAEVLLPADQSEPLVLTGTRVRAGCTPVALLRPGSASSG
jgi:phosphatidylserine decarboxylase